MKVDRLQRILKLVTHLQADHYYPPDDLARQLAVSRRTIFRDLKMLSKAGIPCYYDENSRGYKIDPAFFLPPLNLTLREAIALLLLACRGGGSAHLLPLQKDATEAAAKIENALPPHIRRQCGTLVKTTSARFAPHVRHEGFNETFGKLQNAIRTKHKVKIAYNSFYEKGPIRTVLSPYHLHFAQRAWYVIGHSGLHDAVRIFKITRITAIEMLAGLYILDKPFQIDAYLGRAWSLLPEGTIYPVKLRFSPTVAGNVAEVLWHSTQRLTWHKDESLTFEAEVDGLREITWWILGYGDHVEVLAPTILRNKIAAIIKKMNKIYL